MIISTHTHAPCRELGECSADFESFQSTGLPEPFALHRSKEGVLMSAEIRIIILSYCSAQQCMVLGHLAAAFCVLFDHTGQCVITVSAQLKGCVCVHMLYASVYCACLCMHKAARACLMIVCMEE